MVIHIGEVQKPLHNNSIERCSLYFLVQDLEDLVELKGKDFDMDERKVHALDRIATILGIQV